MHIFLIIAIVIVIAVLVCLIQLKTAFFGMNKTCLHCGHWARFKNNKDMGTCLFHTSKEEVNDFMCSYDFYCKAFEKVAPRWPEEENVNSK